MPCSNGGRFSNFRKIHLSKHIVICERPNCTTYHITKGNWSNKTSPHIFCLFDIYKTWYWGRGRERTENSSSIANKCQKERESDKTIGFACKKSFIGQ